MIEIKLLGHVAVHVDGAPLTGEAAQRRRLALLALLAEHPLKPVTRDQLMLHLWPDNDTDSARHLLSSALHVLRRALGPDALRTSGDEVELNPGRVRVDVAEFEAAVRGEDPERAVALYGGPFLASLGAGISPEFEEWQEGSRAGLARLHAEALERLATARSAAGRPHEAVELWRRLLAQDPYSTRAVVGLMQGMVAAGNRAGAIQAARNHTQLLDAELGTTPDAEVTRLVDQLRLGPAVGTAGGEPEGEPETHSGPPDMSGARSRPSRRVLPAGAVGWVVIFALATAAALGVYSWTGGDATVDVIAVVPRPAPGGNGAADYAAYAVAERIDYGLGRLAGIRVVNAGSAFLYGDSVLDPREIGARLAADLLVTVYARMVSDAPRVRVELLRSRDGHRVWQEQYDGNRAEFAGEDAMEAISQLLGIPVPSTVPGTIRASADPHAYDLYQQGRYAWSRRTPESLIQAVELLQRAIEVDPTYAWAYVGLADAYNMLGSYDYGVLPPAEAYGRARAAALRAIELDRDLAPAHAALANVKMNHDWNLNAAEASFRRAIQLNPGYTPASEWLAYLLLASGRQDEAHHTLLNALEYSPASPLVLTDLAHYHYYRGEHDRAHGYLDRAITVDPAFERAHTLRVLLYCAGGPHDLAIAHLEAAAAERRGTDPILASLLGYALAVAGRQDAARREIAWLRELEQERFVPPEYRAIVHVGLGEHDRALGLLEDAYSLRSSGMIYLGVEPLLDPLRDLPRFQRLVSRVAEAGIEAERARAKGDPAGQPTRPARPRVRFTRG